MWNFSCEKCGAVMHEDTLKTLDAYNEEASYLIKDGEFDLGTLPRYIIFKCSVCNFSLKMNIDDLLKPYLEFVMKRLSEYRIKKCMTDISSKEFRENFSEDHGISFCGICSGFLEGDGYCFNDVMEKCTVRRNIIEK